MADSLRRSGQGQSCLDEPVSADGLFGQSLDAIQAKFELRKKQTEALSSIIPRQDAKPKQQANLHKPAPLGLE